MGVRVLLGGGFSVRNMKRGEEERFWRRKVEVFGIMLSLLLIGFLMSAVNIQLVEGKRNHIH